MFYLYSNVYYTYVAHHKIAYFYTVLTNISASLFVRQFTSIIILTSTFFFSRLYQCLCLWYNVSSVCLSVVCNICIVAKWYVLPKSCLIKQIWLLDCYPVYHLGPLQSKSPIHPQTWY